MSDSVLSYPDRGPWGKSSWAGNCTGFLYRDLYQWFKPAHTVDVFSGSGTAIEVAKEMGIEAVGLDLHNGFNVLRDSILARIGRPTPLCSAHPPYADVHIYSGNVWGKEPHADDLSRCRDDDEFMEKMQLAALNMREATAPGGHYVIIIGDKRKHAQYRSFQAELITRLPLGELRSVLIKQQHNTRSASKSYHNLKFPFIQHEYVLIWEKPTRACVLLGTLAELAQRFDGQIKSTWANIVKIALLEAGGQADLPTLYQKVSEHASARVADLTHWKEKVRQILQIHPELFVNESRGVWKLAA